MRRTGELFNATSVYTFRNSTPARIQPAWIFPLNLGEFISLQRLRSSQSIFKRNDTQIVVISELPVMSLGILYCAALLYNIFNLLDTWKV